MTEEYFELDLPVAPAVMVGDEIGVEGADVAKEKLEAICGHLKQRPSQPQKKGFFRSMGE